MSFLLFISYFLLFHAPHVAAHADPSVLQPLKGDLSSRDDHGAILHELNETDLLLTHAPTPLSYWSIDIDMIDPSTPRYPALMFLHALLMISAFFIALPIRIALRSVNSSWHPFVDLVFYVLCGVGCASAALYSKLTPNMYEHAKHGIHGYLILLVAVTLSLLDLFQRFIAFIRSKKSFSLKNFWETVVQGREQPSAPSPKYAKLVADEPEEYDDIELHSPNTINVDAQAQEPSRSSLPHVQTSHGSNDKPQHVHGGSAEFDQTLFGMDSPRNSEHSDDTLVRETSPTPQPRRKFGPFVFRAVERSLVLAGFGQLLTGVVVYTGGCRGTYLNGCLAHLIKGGIFWCYGLATFARFLGAFSEYGWAWNRVPAGDYVSAEFVESLVIFTYGITNVWMERFGARAGDPFTTKQLQHISIAAMFWFGGLVGMAVESQRVRRWLAASSTAASRSFTIVQPRSYLAGFNPFPALVIGVTGSAMAAHHQRYFFQVQIHTLWGVLLLGFSVMRCLTYFFLWLGPPSSILPSRPPTEALASFLLSCGGLVFIFSTEELTIAAMRRGRDDVMFFLNVAVAITCFAMLWTLVVVAFKGWLKSRRLPAGSYEYKFA